MFPCKSHTYSHTDTHTPFFEWVSTSHTSQNVSWLPISARVLKNHHRSSSSRDHSHSLSSPYCCFFPKNVPRSRSSRRLSPKIGQRPRSPRTNRRPEVQAGGGTGHSCLHGPLGTCPEVLTPRARSACPASSHWHVLSAAKGGGGVRRLPVAPRGSPSPGLHVEETSNSSFHTVNSSVRFAVWFGDYQKTRRNTLIILFHSGLFVLLYLQRGIFHCDYYHMAYYTHFF